jgi:hypothetical protein
LGTLVWCRIARPYNHVVVRPIERPINQPDKRQDNNQCSPGCPACSNGRTKPRLGQSRNGRVGSEPKHVRTRRTPTAVRRRRARVQAEAGRDNERARADDLRDRLIAMQEQLADAHPGSMTE